MKTCISYVVQNEKAHIHKTGVVTSSNPPYSYSADPQVSDMMGWTAEKRKALKEEEELLVVSIYKLQINFCINKI
jgi:hypothetical protein